MAVKDILKNGSNTVVMMTAADLKEFALTILESAQNQETQSEKLYTPAEFANRKRVDKSTLYRWRKSGLLKPHYVGTKLYYRDSDLTEQ